MIPPDRPLRARADDRGSSLMELVMGMTLMVIFMTMFTSSIVMMTRSVNKTESVNRSSVQLNQAFLFLDETVRYAAAISPPAKAGATGSWYVELRTTNTGVQVCTQLRIDTVSRRLERRTWQVVNSVASPPTSWTGVATGITNGGVAVLSPDQPFLLPEQTTTVAYQRLAIKLVAQAGSGPSTTTSRSAIEFTAINSTMPPPSAPICQEVGRP